MEPVAWGRRALTLFWAFAAGLAWAPAAIAQPAYSGAELRTKEAYVYGRFEVRMRSASGGGLLSSFFTYSDASYPTWNEIDLEILGRYANENQFNIITGQAGSQVNHERRHAVDFNPHQGFHVYAFEWYPDSVVFFVDGARAYRALADAKELKYPQKIMMNTWISSSADWVGAFDRSTLPVHAYYDYVAYGAYTPKAGPGGSDFTPQWKDDFTQWDASRWEKASHTFENNLAQFQPANVTIQSGYAILSLTEKGQEGFQGQIPSAIARPSQPSPLFPPSLPLRAGSAVTAWLRADGRTFSAAHRPGFEPFFAAPWPAPVE